MIPDKIKVEEPIPSLHLIKITLHISDLLEKEQNMISNNESKKETSPSFFVVSSSSFEERHASIRSTTESTNHAFFQIDAHMLQAPKKRFK